MNLPSYREMSARVSASIDQDLAHWASHSDYDLAALLYDCETTMEKLNQIPGSTVKTLASLGLVYLREVMVDRLDAVEKIWRDLERKGKP